MILCFLGSHGTGKSTVASRIADTMGEFHLYRDLMKSVTLKSGYGNVKELITENGVDSFMAAVIGGYHDLENRRNALVEHGPLGYMAYYYAHLNKWGGTPNGFVERLAKYYTRQIDAYLYFPVGRIPLVPDGWRGTKIEYQLKIDEMIRRCIDMMNIDPSRIHEVASTGINERFNEIAILIQELMSSS